jgi:hypothetical protein
MDVVKPTTHPKGCGCRHSFSVFDFPFLIFQGVLFILSFLSTPTFAQEAPAISEPTPAKPQDKPPEPPPPIPMELQPYRVRVSVAFDEHPTLTVRVRQEVLSELAVWIERTYGKMWTASIEENHWLLPENEEGLSRLTWSHVGTQLADKDLDKALVLCVSGHGGLLRLSGREWDRMTQQLSVRHERLVADRRALANELGVLMRDLFRPLVLIEGAEAGKGRVRVRAGEFPPPDPSVGQLAAGNFFQPVLLTYNKEREVTQVQMVPWSYLLMESSDRARGECSIHTGLRLPLGKNSKRMESWAIGVRPSFNETRIRLTPHNNPTKPLIGYQVNIYERVMVPAPQAPAPAANEKAADEKPASDQKPGPGAKAPAAKSDEAMAEGEEPKKPAGPQFVPQFNKVRELITDRRGRVTVPLNPERPLIWLYVSSGGNLLGRFPFIPGLSSSTTAELPDDSLRLQIESRLELMRAELTDAVARRALLASHIKGAAKASDWPRFTETLAEFDRQPNAKYFQTLLDATKAAMLKKMQPKKDKSLEKKLDKLCGESTELVARYLSDEKIKQQREELVELKRSADEDTNDAGRQQVPGRRATPAPAPAPNPAPANPNPAAF